MSHQQRPTLQRALGFWALVAYGVGDILGAGIYALVGKIAGMAGQASWIAFAITLLVATFTALSYAELVARFPASGGEARYSFEAFHSSRLALFVGWLVLCSGTVSMATVSRSFSGYGLAFWENPPWPVEGLVLVLFLVGLAAINFQGIRLSSRANIACTLVELFGLLLVLAVGIRFLGGGQPEALQVTTPGEAIGGESVGWLAITQAAALAFFAFIGFEDMVNVAEEVKSPERVFPKAILTALGIAGTVYIVVVAVATSVVPPEQLAASKAPLREVVHRAAPGFPLGVFTLIALFAVANTALLNFIMGSRILFGMADQGLLPRWLSAIHPRTNTPHRSIAVVLVAAILLALSGTLTHLAGTTNVLLLLVFLIVNVSLIVLRLRDKQRVAGFRVPLVMPMLAAVSTMALASRLPRSSLLTASLLILAGIVIAALVRPSADYSGPT